MVQREYQEDYREISFGKARFSYTIVDIRASILLSFIGPRPPLARAAFLVIVLSIYFPSIGRAL